MRNIHRWSQVQCVTSSSTLQRRGHCQEHVWAQWLSTLRRLTWTEWPRSDSSPPLTRSWRCSSPTSTSTQIHVSALCFRFLFTWHVSDMTRVEWGLRREQYYWICPQVRGQCLDIISRGHDQDQLWDWVLATIVRDVAREDWDTLSDRNQS